MHVTQQFLSKKKVVNLYEAIGTMGTETKKGEAEAKDFKPYLTSEDVKAALEQRHVDLLSQSKLLNWSYNSTNCSTNSRQ
jgi:hypothetical protein